MKELCHKPGFGEDGGRKGLCHLPSSVELADGKE